MEFLTLNTGTRMPALGIGTYTLTPDEAENACIYALNLGYRLIDTANAYVNEKVVGRAIKKSGVSRDEIFLETKLWPSFYEDENAVDKTLMRLNTGYVDLLLIHQPAGNYLSGYKQMEQAFKKGKVKAIGLSNFTKAQVEEILKICDIAPSVLQTELHPYLHESELKRFLMDNDIVCQSWYPLGHGDSKLLNEPIFEELDKKYGKTPAQIILRWHIQDGNNVIPGSKNNSHIRDNFDIFDFELSNEDMERIASLNSETRYFTSTPEMLDKFASFVLDVDGQK